MKSANLILIFIFSGLILLFGLNSVSGQEKAKEPDFSVKSETQKENGKKVYSLVITVKSMDSQPYSVFLYDREPWKNGTVLRKAEITAKKSVVISGVDPGKYCVIVLDSRETMKGKWYTVEP